MARSDCRGQRNRIPGKHFITSRACLISLAVFVSPRSPGLCFSPVLVYSALMSRTPVD